MKSIFAILVLILFTATSCVKERIVDIGDKSGQDKLVVLAYLTPGDSIRVFVNKSVPLGKQAEPADMDVLDATVLLRSGSGQEVLLELTDPAVPIYTCSQEGLPVVPGQTYHLLVSAPGRTTVTAETTVPKQKATWKTTTISQTNDGRSEFSGTWDALFDETDIDFGVIVYRPAEPVDFMHGNQSIKPHSGIYTVEREVYVGKNLQAVLITRTKILGQFSKQSELTLEMAEYYSGAGFYDIISGFKGVIPQFSNIENGLGVFGSFLSHSKNMFEE